ncbi:hypothetical protein LTR56_003669 [Elasticomyces elasticus]|nr:hypothetical protein LTR22_016896 [Elasticomyces elasticus]KAK3655247.1 hypothetical protein LTR56_003669 [Elasticomyces elasticus]KAK4913526.1 hypothetical protein LTR49_018142 [Elasticomyces elasticus]KAK5767273.1 hypothetical protein LTS12_002425 [Elasticomyces elasticus]
MGSLLPDSLVDNTSPALEGYCPLCDDAAPLICAGCHSIAYCSRECQEAEFHAHKLVCKAFNGVKEAPADGTVRVLHFPVEGKPEFRCLKLKKTAALVELDYEKTTGDLLPTVSVIDHNAISGAPIESPFHIRYSDKTLPINKIILKATDGLSEKKWRGPVLVYYDPEELAQGNEDVSVTEGRHIDMQAYAHAIAWFSCSGERITSAIKGPKVEAVKVLCNGALPPGEKARFKSEIGMPLRFNKAQTPKNASRENHLMANMLDNANKRTTSQMELLNVGWLQPFNDVHAWVTVTRMKDRPRGMWWTRLDPKAAKKISSSGWAKFLEEWMHDKVAKLNEVNNEALGNEYELLQSIRGVTYKGVPWKENESKEGPVKAVAYAIKTEKA